MPALWNNMKQYAVYRKIFFSYLILVLVTIPVISTVLYRMFADRSIAEINDAAKSMLAQTSYTSDMIQDQVLSVGNELMHDNNIITAMLSDTRDPLLENEVVQKFRYIQAVYSFIEYVSIYNGNTDRYLNYKGQTKELDAEVLRRIHTHKSDTYWEFFPRRYAEVINNTQSYNVLTFILYSNFSALMPNNSALVININEEKLIRKTISGMNRKLNSDIMVVDEKGVVLSHTDERLFTHDISGEPYMQRVLQTDAKEGSFTAYIDGRKQLVTYVKSAENAMGWIYVSKKPYAQVLSGIHRLLVITLLVSAALLLLGLVLSALLTANMSNPLSALFTRAQSLEKSLRTAAPMLKETYVHLLLSGKAERLPHAAEADILEDLRAQLTGMYFCVIVLRIDDARAFAARPYKEQELVRFAVRNIAGELMAKHGSSYAPDIDGGDVVLLLQLAAPALPESVVLTLGEVGAAVRQYFHLSVSAGIGDVVAEPGRIPDSYRCAADYLQYRLFFGHGVIIDRNRTEAYPAAGGGIGSGGGGEYPHRIESALTEAIQLGHARDADKEISRFVEAIRTMSVKQAVVAINRLVFSLLKKFDGMLPEGDGDYAGYMRVIYSFSEPETLDDVAVRLKELAGVITRRLEEKKEHRNRDAIESVRRLVLERYSDPNLSLDWIADQVHYSAGYLGKLFKQLTDQTFAEYVSAVRLEKAVGLLSTTSDSAAVISEKVGIGSSTYFFTLFKKAYGMTPAQFRTQHAMPLPEER
ncbi:helix-turn-helix domain-containing protein [Paenibacillus cymbidii]|uniref:helix-turn-helix domain-containing protein n=1 Tax=Paenibacillus cymbidii TaxID=1639034 RepID=UPI001436B93B|nr:helix-turn-helix domain-containing protein [Paenibacillus cymbidii]